MRRLTLVVAVLCCAAIGAAVAYKAHTRFDENKRCCLVPTARNISLSLREALRITRYQSEIGQDKWVAETIFPGITNGFFLDVGSGDGYMESNTQALEARGWKGICIDPFPRNMGGRTCHMFKDVVSNESGKRVVFHTAGDYGGIADTLGAGKTRRSRRLERKRGATRISACRPSRAAGNGGRRAKLGPAALVRHGYK